MWQHVLICLPEIYYFSSSPIFVSENLKVGIDEKSFYVSVDFSRQRKKNGTGRDQKFEKVFSSIIFLSSTDPFGTCKVYRYRQSC